MLSFSINHMAAAVVRQLGQSTSVLDRAYQRLASGQRIITAADDAAGLSMASSLEVKSRISNQGIKNVNDGISMLNIADAATRECGSILERIRELATQAANGTFNHMQRKSLDREAQSLAKEFNRIIDTTTFNGVRLFSSEGQNVSIAAGSSMLDLSLGFETTHGDGTFTTYSTYPIGPGGWGTVGLHDMNGDGKPDVVGVRWNNGESRIFFAKGDGTFAAPVSVGSNIENLVVGDLNNDGVGDLVVSNHVLGFVNVYMNNGDGTFQAPTSFNPSSGPSRLQLADLTGDGKLDLVCYDWFGGPYNPSFLTGNGDGTFAQSGVSTVFSSVPYIDVNNDGNLDSIVSYDGMRLEVFLGDGTGRMTLSQRDSSGISFPKSPVTGDVDGDGFVDFITSDYVTGTAYVLLNNGDGTFRLGNTFAGGIWGSSAGDFNGDGILDLAQLSNDRLYSNILIGNGDGTFSRTVSVASPAYGIRVGDVNSDGIDDIYSLNDSMGNLQISFGNATSAPRPFSSQRLGIEGVSEFNIINRTSAFKTLDLVRRHQEAVTAMTVGLGAAQSRLQSAYNLLQTEVSATKESMARICDADVAQDMASVVAARIRSSVAAEVLGTIRTRQELVLGLLS